jgi:hypothetical protein
VFAAIVIHAEEAETPPTPSAELNAGERLLSAVATPPTENIYSRAGELDRKLMQDGGEAGKIASELLAVTPQVTSDAAIVDGILLGAVREPCRKRSILD